MLLTKEECLSHIGTITIAKDLFKVLSPHASESFMKSKDLSRFLSILKKALNPELYNKLKDKLQFAIDEDVSLSFESLLNYLYVFNVPSVQDSDIVFSDNSLIILYEAEPRDWYSKKLAIIPKEKDFVVSVISRKEGLSKFRGNFAMVFPEGYHKFQHLFEVLI